MRTWICRHFPRYACEDRRYRLSTRLIDRHVRLRPKQPSKESRGSHSFFVWGRCHHWRWRQDEWYGWVCPRWRILLLGRTPIQITKGHRLTFNPPFRMGFETNLGHYLRIQWHLVLESTATTGVDEGTFAMKDPVRAVCLGRWSYRGRGKSSRGTHST